MSELRLGNPSIPISVSDYGTYIARLERGYMGKLCRSVYTRKGKGVVRILQVPFDDLLKFTNKRRMIIQFWVAEWMIK